METSDPADRWVSIDEPSVLLLEQGVGNGPGPAILGGLSGAGARSLPELGVLAFPKDGSYSGDLDPSFSGIPEFGSSVLDLCANFDRDRRSLRSRGAGDDTLPQWADNLGSPNRRVSTPLVTVLPSKHDLWQRQAQGEPGRAPPRRQRRPRSRDSFDSRFTKPKAMMRAERNGFSKGTPAKMMSRSIDMSGNPADERVDRNVPGPVHDWSGPSPAPESAMLGSRGGPKTRASTGAQSRNSSLGDSLRQVSGGSLADFERGFEAGHRHSSGVVSRVMDRWDTTVRARLNRPVESPFRPRVALSRGGRVRSTPNELHQFYAEVAAGEVRLQIKPSTYAEELLSRLNPHLKQEVHYSATVISRCWRGYLGRMTISSMHAAAVEMQRHSRSRLVRKAQHEQMLHAMATKIQAALRGHQCRLAGVLAYLENRRTADYVALNRLAGGKIYRAWKAKCFRMHIGQLVRNRHRRVARRRWKMTIIPIRQARGARLAAGRLAVEEQRKLMRQLQQLEDIQAGAEEEEGGPQPLKRSMRLRFAILECEGLPSKDVVGANDVYVLTVTDDGQGQRTTTKNGAGAAASWSADWDGDGVDEAGEELVLHVGGNNKSNPIVKIEVYDEDIGSADELIGQVSLADVLPSAVPTGWQLEPAWYDLLTSAGKPAGRVRLSVRLAAPEPEWGLRLVVYECRELRTVDKLDKNDVQVQLTVRNRTLATSTRNNAGARCTWACGRGETLVFRSSAPPNQLLVNVVDENSATSSKAIGQTEVALPTTAGIGGANAEWALEPRWYELLGPDDKHGQPTAAGKVRLSVAFENLTGQEEYDTHDIVHHYKSRKAASAAAMELMAPPAHLLQKKAGASSTIHGGIAASGALGGVHIRMFATQRSQEWRDHGPHAYMLTLGFLQSINLAPDAQLCCDVTLSGRDRTREPPPLDVTQAAYKRCLQVTVLECRHLKKADIFGKNDVFATLDLNGSKQDVRKTAVVNDGGAAPAWAHGAGETHLFENPDGGDVPPHSIVVSVFDEDIGSANDLIGDRSVDFGDMLQPEADWQSSSWFDITDEKGAQCGEIHLGLRWCVPEPVDATPTWQLRVSVIECDNLKKMDIIGKNDVYVMCTVDGETPRRTSTIEGGGASPLWDGGAGETFLFPFASPPPSLGIEVYDEDRDADDLIGKHVLELSSKLSGLNKPWSAESWLPLEDARNKSTGRVRCTMFWEPAPVAKYKLECTVIECDQLAKADVFGKNDVFVTLGFPGLGQERRTSTIDEGGRAPVWGSGTGETVGWELAEPPEMLKVTTWDADVGNADDVIGICEVKLGASLLLKDDSGWEKEGWWDLDRNGRFVGKVRLRFQWHALPEAMQGRENQAFTVKPAAGQEAIADGDDPNMRMIWGSSSIFKVDDGSYQKLQGSFYRADKPELKLGVFTAGLRGLDQCGEFYKDSWITVHRPPPQLLLKVEWDSVPAAKNEPSGVVRLTVQQLLGLDNSPCANVEDGLVLRPRIGRLTPFGPDGIVVDPGKGKPQSAIELGKLAIARRITQVVPMVFEIWQEEKAGNGKKKNRSGAAETILKRRLLSFTATLDASAFAEGVAQTICIDVDPNGDDALRAAARRQFDDVDEDGSGYLDAEELRRLSKVMAGPGVKGLGNAELKAAMAEMDDDESGEIDFDEFYGWWQKQQGEDGEGGLSEMFARQKKKTRGKTKGLGTKALMAKETTTARQAFEMIDADGNGTLDRVEVRQLTTMLGKKLDEDQLDTAMAEMRGETPPPTAEERGELDEQDAIAKAAAREKARLSEKPVNFDQFNDWWLSHGTDKAGGVMGGLRGKLGSGLLGGIMGASRRKKAEDAMAERAAVKEAFEFIDTDRSGTLDAVELRRLLERLRTGEGPVPQKDVLAAMREMRSGEGADYDAISFDNFYHWWLEHKGEHSKGGGGGLTGGLKSLFGSSKKAKVLAARQALSAEELEAERVTAREAFDEIDTDGSNSLDASEIRRLIISLGREEGTLDEAALALAMAEMRSTPLEGGGGGSSNSGSEDEIGFEDFLAWWLIHKQDADVDESEGQQGGSGKQGKFTGMFGRFGRKQKMNRVHPEP